MARDPHTRTRPDREPAGVPRWVKLLVIVLAILALLVVVVILVGGGNHGPSRHGSFADGASGTVAGSYTASNTASSG